MFCDPADRMSGLPPKFAEYPCVDAPRLQRLPKYRIKIADCPHENLAPLGFVQRRRGDEAAIMIYECKICKAKIEK